MMKVSELIDCLKEMDEDLPVYCGRIHDILSDSESVTDVVFAESIKKKDLLGVYLRTE